MADAVAARACGPHLAGWLPSRAADAHCRVGCRRLYTQRGADIGRHTQQLQQALGAVADLHAQLDRLRVRSDAALRPPPSLALPLTDACLGREEAAACVCSVLACQESHVAWLSTWPPKGDISFSRMSHT